MVRKKSRKILIAVDQTQKWGRRIYQGALKFTETEAHWTSEKIQNRPWEHLLQHLRQYSGDGAIIHLATTRYDHEIGQLPFPIVNTSNTVSHPFHSVISNDRTAGRLAGDHLKQMGYLNLVYLDNFCRYSEERLKGLQDVYPSAQIQNVSHQDRTTLIEALRSSDHQTAWVGYDDASAIKLQKLASSIGIHFPASGGLMGFNNDNYQESNPNMGLTSLNPAYEEIGNTAVHVLAQLIDQKPAPLITSVAPLGVEVRHSTSVNAIESKSLRLALKLIHERSGEITVPEILKKLTCSRRALEHAFKNHMNFTPHQYLLKVRAEKARNLLRDSDLNITEIAMRCGFSSSNQIAAVFKRIYGCSPRQIREGTSPSIQ